MALYAREPAILRPFILEEAITTKEAAARAGKSQRTIRGWCYDYGIGRCVGRRNSHMIVSAVALDMHLDGNQAALDAYLAGDRTSETVCAYFARRSIRLPSAELSRPAA